MTGEMLASSCVSKKVIVSLHQKLPPLLVLTCTNFLQCINGYLFQNLVVTS